MPNIFLAKIGLLFWVCLLTSQLALADQQSLLVDRNGDETVSILAFGDSLTYGIGDGSAPGAVVEEPPRDSSPAGYPRRVQQLTGVKVTNSGVPGEQLVADGSDRFVRALKSSSADIALIMEGTNDANLQVSLGSFRNFLQRTINAATALGRLPVVVSIPPPSGNRLSLRPFTDAFTREQERLAFFNKIPLADVARAFKTTCDKQDSCRLLNQPEGLHPNTLGYDVIAQTILATLYGIDIFSENGGQDLSAALGISPSDIKVKPDLPAPVAKSFQFETAPFSLEDQ